MHSYAIHYKLRLGTAAKVQRWRLFTRGASYKIRKTFDSSLRRKRSSSVDTDCFQQQALKLHGNDDTSTISLPAKHNWCWSFVLRHSCGRKPAKPLYLFFVIGMQCCLIFPIGSPPRVNITMFEDTSQRSCGCGTFSTLAWPLFQQEIEPSQQFVTSLTRRSTAAGGNVRSINTLARSPSRS